MSTLSKRATKCLRRIDAGKSIPDIGAMDELEHKGMIATKVDAGEIEIRVTKKGRDYLGEKFLGKRAGAEVQS